MTTLEFLLIIVVAASTFANIIAHRAGVRVTREKLLAEGKVTALDVELTAERIRAAEWKRVANDVQAALITIRKHNQTERDTEQAARDSTFRRLTGIEEGLRNVTDKIAERMSPNAMHEAIFGAPVNAPIPDPPSTREADRRAMEAKRKVAAQMDGYQPVAFTDKKAPPVPRLTEKF